MSEPKFRRSSSSLSGLPKPKWWGRYVAAESPGGRRFVIHWRRILAVLAALAVAGFLSVATMLWGYYSVSRGIPGVYWVDVALPWRFPRVERALAAHHFWEARQLWDRKEYGLAILSARSAVAEDPGNLDARLVLAAWWRQAGRFQEAVRVLRNGIEVDAGDPRLQGAVVQTCLDTGQYEELLKALREDFPAQGVRLLDGPETDFQLAELRAVIETSGTAEAEALAKRRVGLAELPVAAPLLAQIDWEQGRHDAAYDRLERARAKAPEDFNVQDSFIGTAFKMGRTGVARAAALQFLHAYPKRVAPQLRILEVFGSRRGRDAAVWSAQCIRFLEQFRDDPSALGKLASLAASNGWTDLSFLLYQNSLQENLTGFPYAIFYVSSLVKAGDMTAADEVWKDLSVHNPAQLVTAPYVAAMVAWGNGRKSDAEPMIDLIRGQTAKDLHRRKLIGDLFSSFGFPDIADRLGKP